MNHERQHASIQKYAARLADILIPTSTVDRSTEFDNPCFEFDGWIYLEYKEEEVDVPVIGGTRKATVKGYNTSVAKFIPGSHWEPDDVDVVPDQSYTCLNDALARVAELIVANALDQMMEADSEYESWQESQKYAEELKSL